MILEEILVQRRRRLAEQKRRVPLAQVQQRAAEAPPVRAFRRALDWRLAQGLDLAAQAAGAAFPGTGRGAGRRVALLAEVKKASPVKGLMRPQFDALAVARTYAGAGADALSVLTEPDFFLGDGALLAQIRSLVPLPLLRKDFITDPYQVYEARALGADAVLLIVAALPGSLLQKLLALTRELGMEGLLEVHDEAEMARALDAGGSLIGINNRDLRTFRTDLATTERLAALAPLAVTLVSESGIRTGADMRRLRELGVQAALVGEALVRADDIAAKARELLEGGGRL